MLVEMFRSYRVTIFGYFGCSGVVPAIHILISGGWTFASEQASLQWLLVAGALYGNLFSAMDSIHQIISNTNQYIR